MPPGKRESETPDADDTLGSAAAAEAAAAEADDAAKLDAITARNRAETVLHRAERAMLQFNTQLSDEQRDELNRRQGELREALGHPDSTIDQLRALTNELGDAISALGQTQPAPHEGETPVEEPADGAATETPVEEPADGAATETPVEEPSDGSATETPVEEPTEGEPTPDSDVPDDPAAPRP